MRNPHFRISPIELKGMTGLTVSGKTDPLIKMTVGLELVAIIAVEPLPVHRRNVGSEMALVIETKHIGIARVRPFQLEFGMRFPKRREGRGKTLRRPRQFKDDLLRRMRMPMERISRDVRSFLGRRRHNCGIVVTTRALRTRYQSQIIQAAMFLVTGRAGTILKDGRFVKTVLLMTRLALAVDRFDRDAVAKTIAQHLSKFSGDRIGIVTLGAVVGELCVTRRDFTGIEKSLAAMLLKKPNREQTAGDRH
jgi:hypothetical protein